MTSGRQRGRFRRWEDAASRSVLIWSLPLVRLLLEPRGDRQKLRAEMLEPSLDEPERYAYEGFGVGVLALGVAALSLPLAVVVGLTGSEVADWIGDALWMLFVLPLLAVAFLRLGRSAALARQQRR